MEKEFQRMELLRKKHLEKMDLVRPEQLSKTDFRKVLGAQFDPVMFRKDVDNDKPCDEEPLQIAEYYLFRYSNKMGLYHVGLLVCGIEIHFHLRGIEFWKPMAYSTRFVGGIHRDYRTVYYKGRALYTLKSFQFIVSVLKRMETFFNPNTYNFMTRNCLQFVRTLARELTDRLAMVGDSSA
uniref:PPPDE domain-containing protein n=1 Tax=Globodera rostochiensis TaxID=31243 RepID=A0A914H1Y7_GLORO